MDQKHKLACYLTGNIFHLKKMLLFKDSLLDLNEVFNLDKMATLFAEATIMGDFHSLGLWNLKFYLNPETLLIEPIPFVDHIGKLDQAQFQEVVHSQTLS